jgi:hypothetical protein
VFARGDGVDTVLDGGGGDTLQFGPGVSLADIPVLASGAATCRSQRTTSYLDNREAINAVIAANPESAFTAVRRPLLRAMAA